MSNVLIPHAAPPAGGLLQSSLCWHVWLSVSSASFPVVGISTCKRCGKIADSRDYSRAHENRAVDRKSLAEARRMASAGGEIR